MAVSLGSSSTADLVASHRLAGYAGVVAIDDLGIVRHVTDGLDGWLGLSAADVVARPFLDFVAEDHRSQAIDSFADVAGRPGYHQALEVDLTNGTDVATVDVVAENRLDDPTLGVVLLHLADPRDRRRSVQLLDRQAEIVRQIALGGSIEAAIDEILAFVEAALPGFRAAGFVRDGDRITVATSPSLDEDTVDRIALTLESAAPDAPSALHAEEALVARRLDDAGWSGRRRDLPPGLGSIWSIPARLDRATTVHGAIELFGPRGAHPRDEDWTVLRLAGRLVAIAVDHARTQERLIIDAERDPLTGMPNRRVVTAMITRLVERGERGRAVCFIDLDRLKVINDALGHDAGDALIREAGERLARAVDGDAVVGRFGGDEFVAVARNDAVPAEELARRCVAAFKRPILLGGRNWFMSASIGVVTVDDQESAVEVLRDADTAMYEAKRAGRGRWRAFSTADRELVRRRMRLEQHLAEGIRYGGVSAWYQPVVRVGDWQMVATEALARWELEPGVWVPPNEFVPLAEELGLIDELGGVILHDARRRQAELAVAVGRPLTMSVNVSPLQVRSDQLLDQVSGLGANAHLGRFCLEMTEQHMIDDATDTIERLDRLVDVGLHLAVDDFGTGFSSLAMLHQVPAHVLKIDRQLVSQVDDPSGRAVLAAVVGVAGAYGMRTVAEGVETVAEATTLTELGVDALQGFLFAPPEPMDRLVERLGRAWPWEVDQAELAAAD